MRKPLSAEEVLGRKIAAGRALVEWGQQALADEAGVEVTAIRRLERAETRKPLHLDEIVGALARAGVRLTERGVELAEGV